VQIERRRPHSYFNGISTFLNTRLEIAPDRWIAHLGAMRPQALLAVTGFERVSFQVKLAVQFNWSPP
jgi:hypothetical protein